MATITLTAGVDSSAAATAGDDIFEGRAVRVSLGDVLDAGLGNDTLRILTGGSDPALVDLNLPASLTGFELLTGRSLVNDLFQISTTRVAQFVTIDGGTGIDTIALTGGGVVSLSGKTLTAIEFITTDTSNTQLTVTTAQAALVTSMGGASDTLNVGDFLFLTTFGTPATRTAQFALLGQYHSAGAENVSWSEGGATNVATAIVGGPNDGGKLVTSTDSGGNSWASSLLVFGSGGNRVSKTTAMDDGSQVAHAFTADVLVSQTTTGIVGDLSTSTIVFESAGRWDSLTQTLDAGGSHSYAYDDSSRADSHTVTTALGFVTTSQYNNSLQTTSISYNDTVSNQHGFATSTLTLDPTTGNHVSKVTTMDDGSIVNWAFTAGVLASITTTGIVGDIDTSTIVYDSAGRWDSLTQTLDAGGSHSYAYDDASRADSHTVTTASGFVAVVQFNDLLQTTSISYDDTASNQHGFVTSTLTLDPATGLVTQKVTLDDVGNTATETYVGGNITSRVVTDGGVNEDFTSVTNHYFGNTGVFSYLDIAYDNGTALLLGSTAGTADTIVQRNGFNDTIIGNGGADVFVFAAGMDNDTILDFANGVDRLDLTAFGIDSLAELLAGTTAAQSNADVVIDFAGADLLTLKNFALADLDDSDFVAGV